MFGRFERERRPRGDKEETSDKPVPQVSLQQLLGRTPEERPVLKNDIRYELEQLGGSEKPQALTPAEPSEAIETERKETPSPEQSARPTERTTSQSEEPSTEEIVILEGTAESEVLKPEASRETGTSLDLFRPEIQRSNETVTWEQPKFPAVQAPQPLRTAEETARNIGGLVRDKAIRAAYVPMTKKKKEKTEEKLEDKKNLTAVDRMIPSPVKVVGGGVIATLGKAVSFFHHGKILTAETFTNINADTVGAVIIASGAALGIKGGKEINDSFQKIRLKAKLAANERKEKTNFPNRLKRLEAKRDRYDDKRGALLDKLDAITDNPKKYERLEKRIRRVNKKTWKAERLYNLLTQPLDADQ